MKLVAEQLRELRKRKKELEEKLKEYKIYCFNRDKNFMEGIGTPFYGDYSTNLEYSSYIPELMQINSILSHGETVWERNFDVVDIGTRFFVSFADDPEEVEEMILVESSVLPFSSLVSLESDLGKAVLGKKEGDTVTYRVSATGRRITATIDSIDKMKENYEHFIREDDRNCRISALAKADLKRLKAEEPENYQKRFELTESQKEIIKEEIASISSHSKNFSEILRRNYLNRLMSTKVAELPKDNSIGVGSHVEVLLMDENGQVFERKFELINQAYSTELQSQFVERISPLGTSIYGLHPNDTFQVKRQHKPNLKGKVLSVDNEYRKQKEKSYSH